eukprot:CAMPEP_0113702010 /NCGR_PEP_ID=MMETSP0038_2-20120614/24919_1 /TAXON_ID=2898 /ORGANISM="Cryptomonas paramecium" /LENGTH=77 /DNA_ID=CAMNT_0000626019 /DNA_START=225 /DNA_END=458 /DNA_ORIENTATION=+ /assembly_acc=CAM_ASM_000170
MAAGVEAQDCQVEAQLNARMGISSTAHSIPPLLHPAPKHSTLPAANASRPGAALDTRTYTLGPYFCGVLAPSSSITC